MGQYTGAGEEKITARSEFFAGVRDTTPLVVGAIPFGLIFGTLSGGAGLSFAATLGMSLFVFAGSAQFIGMGLWAAGTLWPMVVMTTFVVNLRHLLYGATLVPYIKKLPGLWQVILSFGLTDETFVVAVKRYQDNEASSYKHFYHLGSMLFMYINWNICTVTGLTLGRAFPEITKWGLDFAMPATFIGMVIPYLVTRPMWGAVCTAGIVSCLSYGLPHKLGLMVAAVSGVLAGMLFETIIKRGKG